MTVFDAREICDRVEAGMSDLIPNSHVTIHAAPVHESKHTGIAVLD